MRRSSNTSTTGFHWLLDKRKASLLKNDTELLVLIQEKGGRGTFTYKNARYVVHDEGFWNPKTIMEGNGEQVLVMKRHFLGSKASIEFATGATFHCKVRNAPLVKLTFLSTEGDPVLSYKLDAAMRPRTVLEVTNEKLPGDQLVLLLVLGFHVFKGVIKENDDAGFVLTVA